MIGRAFRAALQAVRARPGRSLLTMVSLFVGVLAIVIIQAGSGAVQQSYLAMTVLSSGAATTMSATAQPGSQTAGRALAAMGALDSELKPVGGAGALMCELQAQIGRTPIYLELCAGDVRGVFPYPIRQGEWLSEAAVAPPQIVVNECAAETLGLAPGSTVTVTFCASGQKCQQAARVAGVVYDGVTTDSRAYMKLDLETDLGRAASSASSGTGLIIYAYAPLMDESSLRTVVSVEIARAFDTGPSLEVQRSDRSGEDDFFTTLTLVFSAVAALSLIVGALGILNIGLATLKERSDELSLRRSFGATRAEVMLTIVAEGQILALLAAGFALTAGRLAFPVLLDWMANGVLVSDVAFPVSAALLGVAASSAAALLGSAAPALRAGKVPIASIMRT